MKKHEESQGPWPEQGHICLECWQRWPCDAYYLSKLLLEGANLVDYELPDLVSYFGVSQSGRQNAFTGWAKAARKAIE